MSGEGNVNSIKHGATTKRHGMVLTALGRRFRHIQGYAASLRRELEAHARKLHGGDLSPAIISTVNLACRFEATAAIALHHASKGVDLPADEVVGLMKTACWATQQRDAAIAKLGQIKPIDPFDGADVDGLADGDDAAVDGPDPDGPEVVGNGEESEAPDASPGSGDGGTSDWDFE